MKTLAEQNGYSPEDRLSDGSLTARIDRRFYPAYRDNWDDQMFRTRIAGDLKKDFVILDLGAGAGIVSEMNFRGQVARVCGIDLDQRVLNNPFLDEAVCGTGGSIPYPDATFDLVFSDNVLEHLDQPEEVFREVARVLKPGGKFLAKTPNRYHYVPTFARLTPLAFHQLVNRLRGRKSEDTFPTRYKANTIADVSRHAARTGLVVEQALLIEGRPEYLRLSPLTYLAGLAWERLVNAVDWLARFRVVLIVVVSKP